MPSRVVPMSCAGKNSGFVPSGNTSQSQRGSFVAPPGDGEQTSQKQKGGQRLSRYTKNSKKKCNNEDEHYKWRDWGITKHKPGRGKGRDVR